MSNYYNKIFKKKGISTGDMVIVKTKEHTYVGIFGEEKAESQDLPYQDLYAFFWEGVCEESHSDKVFHYKELGNEVCLLFGKMDILDVKKIGRIENCNEVREKVCL